jgi:hypothetical protein
MSINRRHMLTGLAVAMPATAIASNADAANADAELFRLEAEFNEACVLWEAVSESVDDVEWKNRRKTLSAAVAEVDRQCAVVFALADRIMASLPSPIASWKCGHIHREESC